MKSPLAFLICFLLISSSYAQFYQQTQVRDGEQEWIKVEFDPGIPHLRMLVRGGTIEADSDDANQGWMLARYYAVYSNYFDLQKLDSERREIKPLDIRFSPDTLGQVLAVYPLPPQVGSVRGLGYDGAYFYLADADINNEKIHRLDPNDNFNVVKTFPAPGAGSFLPWGVASDGTYLYIADGLQDRIFKTDTSGAVISNFATGGPLASGLGYRANELWNADLGDLLQGIPPKIYITDLIGFPLGNYPLGNTVNGVAAHDSAVFLSRNINNGHDIRAMDPVTFTQLYAFPSPVEYPNGLAFDGTYLWLSGHTSGQGYIIQIDLGLAPGPRQPIDAPPFTLVDDGYFNNRFNADFDSEGNVHIVYATQFETVSPTKEIIYGTNKSSVWELEQITHDELSDELPVIQVDNNDVVHIMWNGFSPQDNDVELFYTNNSSGEFLPKIQVTSFGVDGIQGHTWPSMAVQDNGMVHFAFVDAPSVGVPEVYFGTYFQGVTSPITNVSNSVSNYDWDPQIILDSLNNPHIFWNESPNGLVHATNASGTWVKEFITEMSTTRPAAAIDQQGVLHYAVTRSGVVKYGNNATGSFSVDTIAVHAANCFYPQMAVDESGGVHLTYHAFGDSVNSWPGNGEIFYANDAWWGAGKFPQNISQLEDEQEIYPGIAVKSADEIVMGWAMTGFSGGVFSNIRMATTLPDSGGLLSGRINPSDDYHHFGYIEPMDSASWSFEIYNRGTRSLTISDIQWESAFDPPFVVSTDFSGPQSIGFRDTLTVNVAAFIDAPVRIDTSVFSGVLKIMSDDPLEPEKEILLEVETQIVGIDGETPPLITENRLYANYPNPFNPSTTIRFSVVKNSEVKLQIFNIAGQLVKTLADQNYSSGNHSVVWDGTNNKGELQSSGIYFSRLNIGDRFVSTKRMLLLK